ncbi:asparagine synthase-related protein [Streptomyces halobius]|uniref:asparagine synthase (glutamine-hydrolyzing) n=1 Tax=Streptomyces halobius TaxID=2879846 RepID=A0ABY4MBT4_9ACTN|nr:asparagine synthase-related protein [Streptomyces halobius]UQA95160.1 asparagine synthetase B family protein [Streptomyces halobius]
MDFLVLPDHPAADRLIACLHRRPTLRIVPYASGRPWIVGHWSRDETITARIGPRRIALLGTTSATRDGLTRLLRRLTSLDDLGDHLRAHLGDLPGSFFLMAAFGPEVRCQGSLSTYRQLHHTDIGGIAVAGNRPQNLAALGCEAAKTGLDRAPHLGTVDEETLAARLLTPFAPLPLALRQAWRSVHAVPPGHYLTFAPNGRHVVRRWWQPPAPDTPLPDAAEAVRDALSAAVRVRTRHGTLSADLSGGMDSTSLCFLAARAPHTRLITTAWQCRDPANDDNLWSARSAAHLSTGDHTGGGNVGEHLSLPYAEVPTWYTPPSDPGHTDPAGPLAAIRESARLSHHARLVAERGSRLHLVGVGGDELFSPRPVALDPRPAALNPRPVALHSLARRDLRTARQPLRARRLGRWTLPDPLRPLRDSLHTLWNGDSYPQWLATCTEQHGTTGAAWEIAPSMPPWAHPDAVTTVRRLLREAAAEAPEPYAALRAQHETVRAAVRAGEIVRGIDAVASAQGVAYEAPFLDDAVIKAALTVRLAGHTETGAYKPLLATAMRGLVPDAVLGRGTKGDHSAEVYAGLRRHRRALSALCDDSLLARLGLIRPDALRHVLTSLHPHTHTLLPLDPTLAAEYWLRSLPYGQLPPPAAVTPASATATAAP